jgi:hypothetical protein
MHDTGGGETNYLQNPYVLIGGALLIYWILVKKNIIGGSTATAKEKTSSFTGEMELERISNKYRVPKQLIKDTQKMDTMELAQAISDNVKMINKSKMSNDERKHITRMIEYLEYELDKKI